MIVTTDGEDTHGNSDQDIRDATAASGAEIFAVGVGTSIDMPTLNAIASEPKEPTCLLPLIMVRC